MQNPLVEFIERLRAQKPDYDWKPTIAEPQTIDRRLKPCEPPAARPDTHLTVEGSRKWIKDSIMSYLEKEAPREMLLIKALPGTGKTTAAVEAVDEMIRRGKRIAYAGPRHDFFQDVISKSANPSNWYEWLPRQVGDDNHVQTCRYSAQMGTWLYRGYEPMDFCSGICGWDFVNQGCPYHAQKQRGEPAVFIQHQHVALGHPLQFSVLIGDESPIQAFAHEWQIPTQWILPPSMPDDEPMKEILHNLSAAAEMLQGDLQGPQLLEYLGGAQYVMDACKSFTIPVDALAFGTIHRPEDTDNKPFFHLPELGALLMREAKQSLAGIDYPHRVVVSPGHLTLLLRRGLPTMFRGLPVIWLDATGRKEIYEKLFERPVEVVDAQPHIQGKIYQVVDRANGKQSITGRENQKGPTKHADQLTTLIQRILDNHAYQRPVVIGFKDFIEESDLKADKGHFYAARGTNAYEKADAVFIAGAPQGRIYDIIKLAKMIFFDRDIQFKPAWSVKDMPFDYIAPDGMGRMYPVSGFWSDPDLQTILETIREDEIIQAAHRGRPVNHPVDIWLITNLPLAALPPDELLTMREIMDAPQGVNIWEWEKVQKLMETCQTITIKDLEALGFHYQTANKYFEIISEVPGWEKAVIKSAHGGKPTKVIGRAFNREFTIGSIPNSDRLN